MAAMDLFVAQIIKMLPPETAANIDAAAKAVINSHSMLQKILENQAAIMQHIGLSMEDKHVAIGNTPRRECGNG